LEEFACLGKGLTATILGGRAGLRAAPSDSGEGGREGERGLAAGLVCPPPESLVRTVAEPEFLDRGQPSLINRLL